MHAYSGEQMMLYSINPLGVPHLKLIAKNVANSVNQMCAQAELKSKSTVFSDL